MAGKILNGEWIQGVIKYNGGYYIDADGKEIPHGKGYWSSKESGDAYEGDFVDGKRHGKGIWYIWCGYGMNMGNGCPRWEEIYEGDFKNDLPNGMGKWWSESDKPKQKRNLSEKYSGEWKDGKKHGKGEYEYRRMSVNRYIGEWADDNENGFGTLTFETDHVKNVYKDENGNINRDANGDIIMKTVVIYAKGTKYIGEWENGEMHGKGKLVKKDGTMIFEGVFTNGKFNGKEVL